ncbi:unnamed protein product [Bursaphelenchus xylophilus]|uniref:(pine wood nematode) hypothetical protein n=1 Tax=Bursaphelenchus xylophilus TaxID=6326 RepID=A0A1I7RJP4_BURXY|nr:unnamed protein product [Bursaphelenchus xylophilus]CAG9128976.1 unnamed protein product [Bursaphelenchus xylophilus]
MEDPFWQAVSVMISTIVMCYAFGLLSGLLLTTSALLLSNAIPEYFRQKEMMREYQYQDENSIEDICGACE